MKRLRTRGTELARSGEFQPWGVVQSKALKNRSPVPLGKGTSELRSEWWIITTHANVDQSVCFILTLEEVRSLAQNDLNGDPFWLNPPAFERAEYREA